MYLLIISRRGSDYNVTSHHELAHVQAALAAHCRENWSDAPSIDNDELIGLYFTAHLDETFAVHPYRAQPPSTDELTRLR